MKIEPTYPPNIDKIREVFNVDDSDVLFAYGDTIYNPGEIEIPPQLLAHEACHGRQQGSDPEAWWDKYLVDNEFRLEQEAEAHFIEYNEAAIRLPNRHQKRYYMTMVARKLASPLYNNMITYKNALALLKIQKKIYDGQLKEIS